MAHLSWHKETKTTTTKPNRPKGMPAFLSYTPPKPKSEPKSKFNIVQDKREQNLSKIKTTKPKAPPGQPTSGIHTGYGKKDEEVKMPPSNWMDDLIEDQDGPQINKKGQITPSWATTTDDKETSWLDTPGGFHQDTTIKAPFLKTGSVALTAKYYWDKNWPTTVERVEQTRKEWILPTDSWFVKKMKDTVITTLGGITQTGKTGMETGWSLTAQNVGALTAMSTSIVNDIARSVLNMPGYTNDQKVDLMDSIYEPINYGLLEALPYRGFTRGFVHRANIANLGANKATLNYANAKAKYEFKNTIKHFNNIKQKEKKNAPLQLQDNILTNKDIFTLNLKDITDAVIKEPIVKKEIKQLAIRTFEEIQTPKIGSYQANVIANHIRQTNDIVPVQAGVGAAVTPKDLLPAPKLGEPFFNPIKKVVDSLPVNEFDQIQVKDLKQALTPGSQKLQILEIRKPERSMILTKFNDFIANLDEGNIKTVPLETVNKYINDNPIELTINVGENFVSEKLIKQKSKAQRTHSYLIDDLDKAVDTINNPQSNLLYYESPNTLQEAVLEGYTFGNSNFVEKQINLESASATTQYPKALVETNSIKLFRNALKNKVENLVEYDFNETGKQLLDEFENGISFFKDNLRNFRIPTTERERVSANARGVHISSTTLVPESTILKHFKHKIMWNLGFEFKESTELHKPNFLPTRYEKIQIHPFSFQPGKLGVLPESLTRKKQWVDDLLNNFNTRKHFGANSELQYEYILNAPTIRAENMVYDGQPFTSEVLIRMAEGSFNTQRKQPHSIAIHGNLEENLQILMNNLELRDIPEWSLFMDTVKSYEGFVHPDGNQIDKFDGWEKTKDNLIENQKDINKLNKEVELSKLKKHKVDKRPYVYQEPYGKGQYETFITFKYGEHNKFDKYFEVKVTANELSGYPDFYPESHHFGRTKNLIGWTLNTSRTINKTPLNPKGEKMMVAEEFQAPQPFTGPGGVEGTATSPWRGEMTEKYAVEKGTDITEVIKSREKGSSIAEADWYKKVLWANIRFAYDNGFDYLAIPTSKTIKHKTDSGGNYDNYPAVAAKWGFNVISDKAESGNYIGTPMENFGLGRYTDFEKGLPQESYHIMERDWLKNNYGDDKIHIIDLRDREKVFELLNIPQQVGSLKQQTEQLFNAVV